MKKKLLVIIVIFSVLITNAQINVPAPKNNIPSKEVARKGLKKKQIKKQLKLTEAQKKERKSITKEAKKSLDTLSKKKNISVGEMETTRKAIKEAKKTQRKAILTSEQKIKMENATLERKKLKLENKNIQVEKMKKSLKLSDDQIAKLRVLRENARKQIEAVQNDESLTYEEKEQGVDAVKKQAKLIRNQILTPEQVEKAKLLKKKGK